MGNRTTCSKRRCVGTRSATITYIHPFFVKILLATVIANPIYPPAIEVPFTFLESFLPITYVAEAYEPTTEELILASSLPPIFVDIARKESRMKTTAYNPEWHRGCQGSYGLFQIACLHVDNPDDLYNVHFNIEMAEKVFESQGYGAWYNTCKTLGCIN